MPKRKTAAGRAGRKAATWQLLTSEALLTWRQTNKVSRARLAKTVGVSSTSVQNWETGKCAASVKIQRRLADVIAAGPAALVAPKKVPSLWDQRPSGGAEPAITATGKIVTQYVQARSDVSADDLIGLIRSVRQALS